MPLECLGDAAVQHARAGPAEPGVQRFADERVTELVHHVVTGAEVDQDALAIELAQRGHERSRATAGRRGQYIQPDPVAEDRCDVGDASRLCTQPPRAQHHGVAQRSRQLELVQPPTLPASVRPPQAAGLDE